MKVLDSHNKRRRMSCSQSCSLTSHHYLPLLCLLIAFLTMKLIQWSVDIQKPTPLFNVLSLQSDVSSCKTHTTESTIHIAIIHLASSISTWCYAGAQVNGGLVEPNQARSKNCLYGTGDMCVGAMQHPVGESNPQPPLGIHDTSTTQLSPQGLAVDWYLIEGTTSVHKGLHMHVATVPGADPLVGIEPTITMAMGESNPQHHPHRNSTN